MNKSTVVMNSLSAISVRGVYRSYVQGGAVNRVLNGISVDINPSELTLIMGPSGSGKSTLLAVMSGLSRPDAGEVFVSDTAIWSLSDKGLDDFRLKHCGFIFQGFNLFSALTALEQVMLPLNYVKHVIKNPRQEAIAILQAVGLNEKMYLRPQALSGGEKQRVAIARAMVKKSDLIFADEPTSSLDSENGQVIISLLHRAAREYGTTVVAVTHDARLLPYADRVISIEDGVILSDERKNTSY